MKDEELVVLIILDLGPLRNVEHILERERMELKVSPQGLDHLDIPQAIHIEPEHAIVRGGLQILLQVRHLAFPYSHPPYSE